MLDGIHHWPLFIASGLLLNITPGVDMALVLRSSAAQGLRAGAAAALGVGAGCWVHTAAAALGLSALLASSTTAFTLLRWLGAAYLVWLGLNLLRSQPAVAPTAAAAAPATATPWRRLFAQGFLTNALNPKVALFFLAFLPQFIAPAQAHKSLAFLLLGLLFNFNGLWVNLGWAVAAAWLARRVAAVQRGMHWLDRIAGLLFVGFGLKLALSEAPQP